MSVKLTRSPEAPPATPLRGVAEEIRRNLDMSRLLASVLAVVEREADAVNLGQPGQHRDVEGRQPR